MSETDTPPADHRVSVTIDPGASYPDLVFTCLAPVGATCRLKCAEDCGSETYPCFTYGDPAKGEPVEREHAMVDSGLCNVVEWLTNSDPWDCFHGENDTPVRSGPIRAWWEGDFYAWDYAPEPTLTPEMIDAGARAAWGGSDEVWDSFADDADFKEFARECARRTLGAARAVGCPNAFPPERGDTVRQMLALGWQVPDVDPTAKDRT